MSKSNGYRGEEIRIRRVSKKMKEEAINIAAHLGITLNDMMKTRLLDIIASAPEHYRKPFNRD